MHNLTLNIRRTLTLYQRTLTLYRRTLTLCQRQTFNVWDELL
jgi:hypothetical protein